MTNDEIRNNALEEAALVCEDSDVKTHRGFYQADDGGQTLRAAAEEIRKLKSSPAQPVATKSAAEYFPSLVQDVVVEYGAPIHGGVFIQPKGMRSSHDLRITDEKPVADKQLTKEELNFVEIVRAHQGSKLDYCAWHGDLALWEGPEKAGLISAVGSYKWVINTAPTTVEAPQYHIPEAEKMVDGEREAFEVWANRENVNPEIRGSFFYVWQAALQSQPAEGLSENDAKRLKDYDDNVKYLLDQYPQSVRSHYKHGDENLVESLCITFLGLIRPPIERIGNPRIEPESQPASKGDASPFKFVTYSALSEANRQVSQEMKDLQATFDNFKQTSCPESPSKPQLSDEKPRGWLAGDTCDGGEMLYHHLKDAQHECDKQNAYTKSLPDFEIGDLRFPEPVYSALQSSERDNVASLDILAERRRQVEVKDYDADHDDEHTNGEIAAYAAFYALPPAARDWPASETGYGDTFGRAIVPEGWFVPKEGDRRRELIKAGALILAEIERLDRANVAIAASATTKGE